MRHVLARIGIVGCALAAGCAPPEQEELTRATSAKLLVPPLLEFDASPETVASTGVENWGFYFGRDALYLTGYAKGKPVRGASAGFRTSSDEESRELVAELTAANKRRFSSATSFATGVTTTNGPLSESGATFRTAALRDVSIARRALRNQAATAPRPRAVSGATCSQNLLTLFMNAFSSGTGAKNPSDLARRAMGVVNQANARCAGVGTSPRPGVGSSAGSASGARRPSSAGAARSPRAPSTAPKPQSLDLNTFCKTNPKDCSAAKQDEVCINGGKCTGLEGGKSQNGMESYACDEGASGICWAPTSPATNSSAGSSSGFEPEPLGPEAPRLIQVADGAVDYKESGEAPAIDASWQSGDDHTDNANREGTGDGSDVIATSCANCL